MQLFWRYQKGKAEDHLATIEAIYHFCRELHTAKHNAAAAICRQGGGGGGWPAYTGQYDDLLYYYAFQCAHSVSKLFLAVAPATCRWLAVGGCTCAVIVCRPCGFVCCHCRYRQIQAVYRDGPAAQSPELQQLAEGVPAARRPAACSLLRRHRAVDTTTGMHVAGRAAATIALMADPQPQQQLEPLAAGCAGSSRAAGVGQVGAAGATAVASEEGGGGETIKKQRV